VNNCIVIRTVNVSNTPFFWAFLFCFYSVSAFTMEPLDVAGLAGGFIL